MIESLKTTGTAFTQESLYFMLMYAWRMWPGGHVTPATKATIDAPSDLMAKLLSNAINKAHASGLQRSYITIHEETLLPSGRILMQETIRNRSQRRQLIHVERDSFSANCMPNKILRDAAQGLLTLKLNRETKIELTDALKKLTGVSDTDISEREILTEMDRTRRLEYRIGLSIALTMKQASILGATGTKPLAGQAPHIGDERWFRSLFESFLREFYRHNLRSSFVGGRRYLWSLSDTDLFPIMQTDINIETEHSILVIDAKCTAKVVSKRQDFNKETLNSDHLYQVFSYMSHCSEINPDKKISGALIYPLYETPIDAVTQTPSGPLRVKTIDFKREWTDISEELLDVALGSSNKY